jgi:hypothetical protein
MPTTITTKELIPVTLGLELNGKPYSGIISSQIGFLSSNTDVLGVKDDPQLNTLDLLITGAGEANLTLSADCTFPDPQSGQQITQNKSKRLKITSVQSGSDFVVTIS